MPARHRVVVVGGGFGGLACARALDGHDVDVLLIDRHNYHLFTPLLYQVATSLLNPSDIAYPFRSIFRRSKNVRFRQARVAAVDGERRVVGTDAGEEFGFDSLVLATGSTNDYFSNRELAGHTLAMKALSDAMRLRNHVLSCLELATRAGSEAERRRLLTFVIGGGGPTGVEYAGALRELLDMVLGRDYPELSLGMARIVLVEGLDRLLSAFHPKLGEYARRTLTERRVEVKTSTLVRTATSASVSLSDGEEIETRTVVWSAGVRPTDPLGDTDPVPRSRSKRLMVDERLRLGGHPGVYVVGDAASVSMDAGHGGSLRSVWRHTYAAIRPGRGHPPRADPAPPAGGELPMLSPPAMQAGRYVARSIRRAAAGAAEDLRPFRYVDKGTMATIGRRAAVADVHGFKLRGTLGWLAWLLVHIYYLIGFRNRAVVLGSWSWNYLKRDRPIRLILRSQGDPLAEILEPGATGEA